MSNTRALAPSSHKANGEASVELGTEVGSASSPCAGNMGAEEMSKARKLAIFSDSSSIRGAIGRKGSRCSRLVIW